MNQVSFVVNGNSSDYYQAELLLHSLNHFAQHPKKDIHVFCTRQVDKHFLDFLAQEGYPYSTLDHDAYTLASLRFFSSLTNTGNGGVFFLDVNTFVLAPLHVPEPNKACAKITALSNTSIEMIQNLCSEAGLSTYSTGSNDTENLATHFKDLYYIPYALIPAIECEYNKWKTWLCNDSKKISPDELTRQADQLAVKLTMQDLKIEVETLGSNYNFPLYSSDAVLHFNSQKPIYTLNYQDKLSPLGVLEENKRVKNETGGIVSKINTLIGRQEFRYLSDFKKGLIQPIDYTENTKCFEEHIKTLTSKWNKKIKLVMHVGTPKTGTTSIQHFLFDNRKKIVKTGILYPNVVNKHDTVPKHQWIVDALLDCNVSLLIDKFTMVMKQVDKNTETIFLSTEGIFNHWYTYTQESKSYLAVLSNYFDVHYWVCYRKPTSFFSSFYKQLLKNPQIPSIESYGKSLSLLEMMEDPWFVRHIDYDGFLYELETLVPRSKIKIFAYNKDIVSSFCHELGITLENTDKTRENTGLCRTSIEILKIINRFPTSIEQKRECLDLVNQLEKTLSLFPQKETEEDDENAKELITLLSENVLRVLKKEYGIHLKY